MQVMQSKVIVLFGPTSSGKTALSLDIAKYIFDKYRIQSEMINADSRQVYKAMNVGTAKVSSAIRKQYTHHSLSVLPPTEQYTVERFQKDARKIIEAITSRGNMPIVVGGTGTYVMSLVGNSYLKKAKQSQSDPYKSLMLIPAFERQSLYRKIETNVDKMFQEGLYSETKNIISAYHAVPKQLGKTHGYREFVEYAKQQNKNVFRLNEPDLEKVKYLIKVDTKKYAMHQTAWLEKMSGYHLVNSIDEAKPVIDAFLTE